MRFLLSILLPFTLYADAFVIAGAKGGQATSASTTIYHVIGMGFTGGGANPTAEADTNTIFRTTGTLSKLTVHIVSYDRATGTVKTRKAGANGGQTVSITGSGDFTDSSGTDAVTAGDLTWDSQYITGAGGTTSVLGHLEYLFTPTTSTNALTKFTSWGAAAVSSAATYYLPPSGPMALNASTPETDLQFTSKMSATWRNLFVNIATNSIAATSTLRSRKNTANGGQAVSITASTTGQYEDTSGTDSIISGSLMNCSLLTTTTGTLNVASYGSELVNTSHLGHFLTATGVNNGLIINTSSTQYAPIGNLQSLTTEADEKTDVKGTMTLSNLQIHILSNSITSTSTFRSRKNAANGGQTISVAASTTGLMTDASGSDSMVAGDLFNYQFVTSTGGTSIGYNMVSTLVTLPTPPPPASNARRRFIGL